MVLTTDRMQQIMVDADLGRPKAQYSAEELEFREAVDVEISEARARGERLEFTSELP